MCPTASYDGLLNRGSAIHASLAFASVNPVQHLKIAAIPVRVDVIGDRRSAMGDRKFQRFDHHLMQLRRARRAQSRRDCQGMNA
jgi:hypothetical protein